MVQRESPEGRRRRRGLIKAEDGVTFCSADGGKTWSQQAPKEINVGLTQLDRLA